MQYKRTKRTKVRHHEVRSAEKHEKELNLRSLRFRAPTVDERVPPPRGVSIMRTLVLCESRPRNLLTSMSERISASTVKVWAASCSRWKMRESTF